MEERQTLSATLDISSLAVESEPDGGGTPNHGSISSSGSFASLTSLGNGYHNVAENQEVAKDITAAVAHGSQNGDQRKLSCNGACSVSTESNGHISNSKHRSVGIY